MDQLETYLSILIDGMVKKERSLIEILSITENQNTVIESELPKDEIMAFIVNMNREKQLHIQTVIDCDNLFERILKEAGPELDAKPDLYKPQIAELQSLIKKVMDLDVSIRVREDKNNEFIKKAGIRQVADPGARKGVKQAKDKLPATMLSENRVIEAYKQNSRDYRGDSPNALTN